MDNEPQTKPPAPQARMHCAPTHVRWRMANNMRERIIALRDERGRLARLYDERETAFIASQLKITDEIWGISQLIERYWRAVGEVEFEPMQDLEDVA
jgi:hypothetical protein